MTEESLKHRPDLFVGLVCAAGTNLTDLKAQIEAQLRRVHYDVRHVKVSSLISEVLSLKSFENEYVRIKSLMQGGDLIRQETAESDGVAALIVAELRRMRGGNDELPNSTVYLIDSLKNPAEVELLEKIYGRNFYTVSVYLPKEERTENLKNIIARSKHQPPDEDHEKLAIELIDEDEKGKDKSDQDVRGTFPLADSFVNAKHDSEKQISRFVNLIFQEPFTTPTRDEYMMFLARATAMRSCDLSRQVGAVIASQQGWVVATGCNEVPIPGGGFFEEGMPISEDNRDHNKQYDPNYIEIQRSLIEFLGVLQEADIVSSDKDSSEIVDSLLHGEFKKLTSNARVRNLIEFGRVVHAEMHALSQAAASGRSVQGSTMFVTTFPCHGCARHIVASGVDEVVYIEPYPKSLTMHLYDREIVMTDSTKQEQSARSRDPVRFRSFQGISPTLYQRVFRHRPRKDAFGTKAEWQPQKAIPSGAAFGIERSKLEISVSHRVAEIVESVKSKMGDGERGE